MPADLPEYWLASGTIYEATTCAAVAQDTC